jgi:hypothetical protein
MTDQETYANLLESFGVNYVVVAAERVFIKPDPNLTLVMFGDWHFKDDNNEDAYPPEDDPLYDGPPGYCVMFTFDAQGRFVRGGVGI